MSRRIRILEAENRALHQALIDVGRRQAAASALVRPSLAVAATMAGRSRYWYQLALWLDERRAELQAASERRDWRGAQPATLRPLRPHSRLSTVGRDGDDAA